MPERFCDYWQWGRSRLAQGLQRAQAQGADQNEAIWLNRLRHIVEDQFARWSHDLSTDRLTGLTLLLATGRTARLAGSSAMSVVISRTAGFANIAVIDECSRLS